MKFGVTSRRKESRQFSYIGSFVLEDDAGVALLCDGFEPVHWLQGLCAVGVLAAMTDQIAAVGEIARPVTFADSSTSIPT